MSIILYGAPLSPFVRKADALLREKGVDFEQTPSRPIFVRIKKVNRPFIVLRHLIMYEF